tara:strand:+ start:663 stop:2462 length:1800 start_codon:yes stop_codon:yes gene_type:complete
MAITYRHDVVWQNFHYTIGDRRDAEGHPYQMVSELAQVAQSQSTGGGLNAFAAHARDTFGHLEHLLAKEPNGAARDAGLQGAKWSFSKLTGNKARAYDCATLKSLAFASDDELVAGVRRTGPIALVGGGTTLAELTAWSEPQGFSLKTSGSFLHSTLAGSVATASHGSRLGYGGIQNMVRGMHLAVAPGRHCWIERASAPVLSDKALRDLAAAGTDVMIVRDDRHFENALIHLGAMGVVLGLAVELTRNIQFARLRLAKAIDTDWLRLVEQGKFTEMARRHGVDHSPEFYELTIEPTAPMGPTALHTWYFKSSRTRTSIDSRKPGNSSAAFANLAAKTLDPIKDNVPELLAKLNALTPDDKSAGGDPGDMERALGFVLRGTRSALDYYRKDTVFRDATGDFDPASTGTESGTWGALHPGCISTGEPGALYNASFAISRERTGEAVRAICAAVADLPPVFLFTLRFVSQPAGTLAFTRFQENTVIEIDGLSPLAMQGAALALLENPETAHLASIVRGIENTTAIGAKRVRPALRNARVDYSMHWGKLGDLDGAKVVEDFGGNGRGDGSLIEEWRTTRELLVPPHTRHLFENAAIREYRLV